MEEMGLKVGRLKITEQLFRNGSSGGGERRNLPGVRFDKHWGVRFSRPDCREALHLI